MSQEQAKKNKIDITLLSRVLELAKPYRLLFIFSGFLAIILAPLGVLTPYLIQQTVDKHILGLDSSGLLRMMFILTAVLIIRSVLQYIFMYSTNLLGQSVIRDLRVRVFNHITSLKLTYFDRTPIGTSTTRTISDIEKVNDIFSSQIIQ